MARAKSIPASHHGARLRFRRPADIFPTSSFSPFLGRPLGVPNPQAAAFSEAMDQTRESCIECVDKHLGAALVLLTETRDGYGHRLRAIGHLHEAEDESQAWPELHNAIREARKRFQQFGTVPDFVQLDALSRKVRASGLTNALGLAGDQTPADARSFPIWPMVLVGVVAIGLFVATLKVKD